MSNDKTVCMHFEQECSSCGESGCDDWTCERHLEMVDDECIDCWNENQTEDEE